MRERTTENALQPSERDELRSAHWEAGTGMTRWCVKIVSFISLVSILPLVATLSGCTQQRSTNTWPVFYRESDPELKTSHTEFFWPLGEIDQSEEHYQCGVHPLLNFRKEPAEDAYEVQSIYPVFQTRDNRSADDQKTWLFPVYWSCHRKTPQGDRSLRAILPLLRISGEVPEKGRFAITPIYGKMYDKLGYDKIDTFLFPMYLHTEVGDRQSHNIVFPFFSYTHANDYKYIRAWPLAGYAAKGEEFAHGFLLWPFFSCRAKDVGNGQKGKGFFIFPLYGQYRSPKASSTAVLWPFFSHHEIPSRYCSAWSVPAPLISFAQGDDYQRTTVWPLYGHTVKANKERRYVLWPLYQYSTGSAGDKRIEERATWPSYLDQRRSKADGDTIARSMRIWPLLRYQRDTDGSTSLTALSIFPFEDPDGIERNWSVFWKIIESKRSATGNTSFRLVGRLFVNERGNEYRKISVGPLLDWERDAQNRSLSFLGGLLRYSHRNGASTWKILGASLPFGHSRGHNTTEEQDDTE